VLHLSAIIFLGSYFEVVIDHGVEKKEVNSEEAKIIQVVEKNPTVSRNETVKCFVLPPSSLSNIIIWKSLILEEENCGAHSEIKKLILLNKQGPVPCY
jgi:hypothetical protein